MVWAALSRRDSDLMPEIAGQRITGTPLSERECFQRAIEGLSDASHALRGMAALRKDARWLIPVRILDQVIDRIRRLKDQGGARVLWLPDRLPR